MTGGRVQDNATQRTQPRMLSWPGRDNGIVCFVLGEELVVKGNKRKEENWLRSSYREMISSVHNRSIWRLRGINTHSGEDVL